MDGVGAERNHRIMLPRFVTWIADTIEIEPGLDEPSVLFVLPLEAPTSTAVVEHPFVRALLRWRGKDEDCAWRLWASAPEATSELDRYFDGDDNESERMEQRIEDALRTSRRPVIWLSFSDRRSNLVRVGGHHLHESGRRFERFAAEVQRHGFAVELDGYDGDGILGYMPDRGYTLGWDDIFGDDWGKFFDRIRACVRVEADLDTWHESAVDALVRALIRAAPHVAA